MGITFEATRTTVGSVAMFRNRGILLAAILIASPIVATATPVTYSFTGTVTSATGIYGGANLAVGGLTGTFSIDLAAGDPTESFGTVGSTTSSWSALDTGGSAWSNWPVGVVFSATLSSGGVSYSTPTIGGYYFSSQVQAYGSGLPDTYFASQQRNEVSSYDGTFVTLLLTGGTGANAPYDAMGMPLLSNASSATGQLVTFEYSGATGILDYTITSLTPASPVPLPATAWLLLSGIGGLGAVARRKRNA